MVERREPQEIELPADARSLVDGREAAPSLATVLWLWDTLALELGDAAVFTAGSSWDRLLGRVALWRGASPVLRLAWGADADVPDTGVERVACDDPRAAIERLSARSAHAGGFAAVDFSGRAEVLDVLLEALPKRGRLLLAARRSAPATVDFYNNVHRKGARVIGACIDPLRLFDDRHPELRRHLALAMRILANERLARLCLPHTE